MQIKYKSVTKFEDLHYKPEDLNLGYGWLLLDSLAGGPKAVFCRMFDKLIAGKTRQATASNLISNFSWLSPLYTQYMIAVCRTEAMRDRAKEFSMNASMLANKYKDQKWYQL